jgi:hypothetical protein
VVGVLLGAVGAWLLGRGGHVHLGAGIGGPRGHRPAGRNARYSGLGRFR